MPLHSRNCPPQSALSLNLSARINWPVDYKQCDRRAGTEITVTRRLCNIDPVGSSDQTIACWARGMGAIKTVTDDRACQTLHSGHRNTASAITLRCAVDSVTGTRTRSSYPSRVTFGQPNLSTVELYASFDEPSRNMKRLPNRSRK